MASAYATGNLRVFTTSGLISFTSFSQAAMPISWGSNIFFPVAAPVFWYNDLFVIRENGALVNTDMRDAILSNETITIYTLTNGGTLKLEGSGSSRYFAFRTADNVLAAEMPCYYTDEGDYWTFGYGMLYDEDQGWTFVRVVQEHNANEAIYIYWMGSEETGKNKVNTWLTGSAATQDPYETAPDSTPDGGYGDYDYSGDDIGIPALPSWSITDSGFVTLYKPTLAQIKSLAQYLWTGVFDLTTYKKIFADPMDCIISLSRVPIDAEAAGTHVLSVGNISTGLTFNVLSNQFVEVSFISKNIGLRANGFLDYAPYVKVQLYLPFIGMRALSIDDIAGKVLTLKYQIDLFTGACTAYLKCKTTNSDGNEIDSVLYQFTGNVLANIPITQANYSSFIQSVISAAAKTGTALISGGAAAAGAAAISSGINVAANIKPDIERSGNMTATGGFLGVKKPYLIVTYPNICKPRNRDKTVAIPSFIGLGIQSNNSNLKLSDFKGLTILHKINVKKIPCTEVERQMIETQLTTEGVIL